MSEFIVFALWVLGTFFVGPVIMLGSFMLAGLIGRRRVDGHVSQAFVVVAGQLVAIVWFAAALAMSIVSGIAWVNTL